MPASMPGPAPALALDRITCTFAARPGKDGNAGHYTAVKDTSLSVAAGEFVSVVGPTGCGKSTLLNVAAGLLEPSAGSVRIDGATLSGINERAGYMFQADALMPWRSALANVRAGLEFHGAAKAEGTVARSRVAGTRRPCRIRGPLSAPALGRDEKTSRTRANADPRPAAPADGRAVLSTRRADAAADGKRAARPVAR